MGVVKSGMYLIFSTGLKIVLGAIGVKVICYYIGTTGFGKLGQFMSLMSVIAITAGGGISNGIISKVSQYKDDSKKLNNIISAGFWIGIIFSLVIGIVLFFFSIFFSRQLSSSEFSPPPKIKTTTYTTRRKTCVVGLPL